MLDKKSPLNETNHGNGTGKGNKAFVTLKNRLVDIGRRLGLYEIDTYKKVGLFLVNSAKVIFGLIVSFLRMFFIFLTSLPLLAQLGVILAIAGFGWLTLSTVGNMISFFFRPPEVKVSTNLLTFEKEYTLFTDHILIDVVIPNIGYTTIQLINPFYDGAPDATLGYCKKSYEVGIGYKNLHQLIIDLCSKGRGSFDELPDPEILSVNPISSEVRGKFEQEKCDQLDMNVEKRLEKIKEKINPYWESISKNSKETLYPFVKLFCH